MRIGAAGAEKPVARVDDETYVDLSDTVTDFDEAFFGSGGLDLVRPVVAERTAAGQVARFAGERIGAPIARPHQILCIGLNYRDHAAESGMAVPDEPILFTKSPDTLVGPNDDVRIPHGSTKPGREVELGMWLDVNGVRRQNGNTKTMIFDPYFTPPGVGMGFDPPVWLRSGDVMELGIARLGSRRQHVLGPR